MAPQSPEHSEILDIDLRKSDIQDLNGLDGIVPVNNADYVGIRNVGHQENS